MKEGKVRKGKRAGQGKREERVVWVLCEMLPSMEFQSTLLSTGTSRETTELITSQRG